MKKKTHEGGHDTIFVGTLPLISFRDARQLPQLLAAHRNEIQIRSIGFTCVTYRI